MVQNIKPGSGVYNKMNTKDIARVFKLVSIVLYLVIIVITVVLGAIAYTWQLGILFL